jgi:uncharacterized protein (DUF2249 family)
MIESENAGPGPAGGPVPAAPAGTAEASMDVPTPERTIPVIDVAALPPGGCRATIEGTFEALRLGESLEVVVGHDPLPLRRRFEVERPGQSSWRNLEAGPVTWRVRVERIA